MDIHNRQADNSRRGYVYVILAAVLWAVSGTAAKFLFHSGISPFQLVQLRTTIAGATLLTVLLVSEPSLLRISKKDVIYFLILGMSLASVQFTYLYTISTLPVAAAVLLQYQAPVFITLYGIVFMRRKISLTILMALAGAVFGCYLTVGGYRMQVWSMNHAGIVSGFASAVSFGWYSVQSEYGMRTYAPWTVLIYALLFASIIWNILHPPFEAFSGSYSAVSWWWVFFIAGFGTILPFGFFNKGIHLITATHASITGTAEPITAAIISYLFLNETMQPLQMAGAVMVICAIILLQMKKNVH